MQDQVRARLAELKAEFAKGKQKLEDLENQTREIQHALLRISGAIQVLEEFVPDNSNGHDIVITPPSEDVVHAGQAR